MPRVVADIYPMLRFLLPELRDQQRVFDDMTQAPALSMGDDTSAPAERVPLLQLLHLLMLRREHRDLPHEVNLPAQSVERAGLLFNSLERYFYDTALERSQRQYHEVRWWWSCLAISYPQSSCLPAGLGAADGGGRLAADAATQVRL